jgi:hypothetical protein
MLRVGAFAADQRFGEEPLVLGDPFRRSVRKRPSRHTTVHPVGPTTFPNENDEVERHGGSSTSPEGVQRGPRIDETADGGLWQQRLRGPCHLLAL